MSVVRALGARRGISDPPPPPDLTEAVRLYLQVSRDGLQDALLAEVVNLADAQVSRRAREEEILLTRIDSLLDEIGLSQEEVDRIALSTADVTPDDRKKLKGILSRLAKLKHPFSQCMRDLAKHRPEWSDDRRKKTCAVLKQISHPQSKSGGSKSSLSLDLEDGALALLTHADTSEMECS